jgi:hypothetical protein
MEEVAELYLPASQSLQISGPSKSLYFPAGQGSHSVVAPTDPLPNPHDAHGSKNAVLMSDSPVATVKPALSLIIQKRSSGYSPPLVAAEKLPQSKLTVSELY